MNKAAGRVGAPPLLCVRMLLCYNEPKEPCNNPRAHSYEKCEDPLVKGGRGMSDAAVCAGAEEVLERYAATVFAAAYAMVKTKRTRRTSPRRCSSAM